MTSYSKHEHEIINPRTGSFRCVVCYTDLGTCNMRPYCGKYDCESSRGHCSVCYQEAIEEHRKGRMYAPLTAEGHEEERAWVAGYVAAKKKNNKP